MNIALYRKCAALRGLPHNEKHVLTTLASFASKDSTEAYPSVSTLAENTSLSTTTVRKQLRALEAAKLIEPRGNGRGGKGCSTVYCIHPENSKPNTRVLPLAESNPTLLETIPNTFGGQTQHTGVDEGFKEKEVVAEPAAAIDSESQMEAELTAAWEHYLSVFKKDEIISPSARRIGMAILAGLREKYPTISSEDCVGAMTSAIDRARHLAKTEPKKAFFSKWFAIFGKFETFHSLWEEA